MKRALIIGSEGQDGTLLKMLLESKSYEVFGVGRQNDEGNRTRYIQADLSRPDLPELDTFIPACKPDEIYYVAAFHRSSQEADSGRFDHIARSMQVNHVSFLRVMDLCRHQSPATRIFYTSSSLVFAGSSTEKQTEETQPAPACIYGLSKVAAMEAAAYYRRQYGLFVSVGIMYNHESCLRGSQFLSKKITEQTRLWFNKKIDQITIGDLSAVTDWGYAPDYVEAMWHLLQLPAPDTFIISSGTPHKVQHWFETLFRHLGGDWRQAVTEDPSVMVRRKPVLIGDNNKLLASGWSPKVSFEEMVMRIYNNII